MRWLAIGLAAATVLGPAAEGRAFCGFYIKEDDTRLTASASRVALLRDGTTTVLSMQNGYEGPPEDFALIVPIPTAIDREDVRVLEPEVFDRIDELTSPRLVEYWEQEPWCADGRHGLALYGRGYGAGGALYSGVRVEAQFAVGEYDVQVLGADESTGLERWLREQGYQIPAGASEALRPYVQGGFRFFAARVNARRVRFEDGRAMLSPLRIRYESDQLVLPIRLGRLNSPGEQDLIVYVLSREGRFEVANRDNVFVPTNVEVNGTVRGRFGAFYDALLDRVWRRHPDSVVTEYSWTASTCDPCPGPPMSATDLTSLGGDAATGAVIQEGPRAMRFGPTRVVSGPRPGRPVSHILQGRREALYECVTSPRTFETELIIADRELVAATLHDDDSTAACIRRALTSGLSSDAEGTPLTRVRVAIRVERSVAYVQRSAHGFTVTRMRYRYGDDAPATDLVFRAAPAAVGGRGMPDEHGELDQGVRTGGGANAFQARYAILHRRRQRPEGRCQGTWTRGGWGGPPDGVTRQTSTASALARRRGRVRIEHLIRRPIRALRLQPARPGRPRRPRGRSGAQKALAARPERPHLPGESEGRGAL